MSTITLKTKEETIIELTTKKLEYQRLCSEILDEIGEDKCFTDEQYKSLIKYSDLYDCVEHEISKLEGKELHKNWLLKLLRL